MPQSGQRRVFWLLDPGVQGGWIVRVFVDDRCVLRDERLTILGALCSAVMLSGRIRTAWR